MDGTKERQQNKKRRRANSARPNKQNDVNGVRAHRKRPAHRRKKRRRSRGSRGGNANGDIATRIQAVDGVPETTDARADDGQAWSDAVMETPAFRDDLARLLYLPKDERELELSWHLRCAYLESVGPNAEPFPASSDAAGLGKVLRYLREPDAARVGLGKGEDGVAIVDRSGRDGSNGDAQVADHDRSDEARLEVLGELLRQLFRDPVWIGTAFAQRTAAALREARSALLC